MRRALLAALILAAALADARADDVVVGKLPYRSVKVVDVTGETITFDYYGRKISKPLAELTSLTLTAHPRFTQAESALAEGKYARALALYNAAAAAPGAPAWLGRLVAIRQPKALAGMTGAAPDTGWGKPSAPSTQPTGPGKVKVDPDDPLATPKSFADLVGAEPKNPLLAMQSTPGAEPPTEGQKRAAEVRHRAAVARWSAKARRLRGKKVTWTLTYQRHQPIVPRPATPRPSTPPRNSGTYRPAPRYSSGPPNYWRVGHAVTFLSEQRITVIANVMPLQVKVVETLKPNDTVRVTGRIRRDLEPGGGASTVYLDMARIEIVPKPAPAATGKPAAPGVKPPAPAPAKPAPAAPSGGGLGSGIIDRVLEVRKKIEQRDPTKPSSPDGSR